MALILSLEFFLVLFNSFNLMYVRVLIRHSKTSFGKINSLLIFTIKRCATF